MFYRAASVGSWGVTSIGKGFNWNNTNEEHKSSSRTSLLEAESTPTLKLETVPHGARTNHILTDSPSIVRPQLPSPILSRMAGHTPTYDQKLVSSPVQSRPASPYLLNRSSSALSELGRSAPSRSPSSAAVSPSSPRPRRRSSRQRVSLIAGRVSIAPIEPPSPPPLLPQSLQRSKSGISIASAVSTRPPSPSNNSDETPPGQRSISDYEVEGDIGRGAYGLVKRAREILADGSLGVRAIRNHPFSLCLLSAPASIGH
jgi:protein-serine/threonine kinase